MSLLPFQFPCGTEAVQSQCSACLAFRFFERFTYCIKVSCDVLSVFLVENPKANQNVAVAG